MSEYIKVEGHPGLVRDKTSQAIINTNKEEYENYLYARKKKIEELNRMEKVETKIENLNNELSEIKSLMNKILDKL